MIGRTILIVTTLSVCAVASAQSPQQPQLPGRYYTPATFIELINDSKREPLAQVYLMGTYDLTQDAHQSCAIRGTTSPQVLEKVFIDYIKAHPDAITADRTAGGVAAQAFAEHWPCKGA